MLNSAIRSTDEIMNCYGLDLEENFRIYYNIKSNLFNMFGMFKDKATVRRYFIDQCIIWTIICGNVIQL